MIAPSSASRPDPADLPATAEQRIRAAARDLFLERGYADTSMDEVARRAHASKTTLYNHFPSKEALFAACVEAECAVVELGIQPAALIELPLASALTEIARRFLALAASPATIRIERVLANEAPRFPTLVATFWQAGPQRIHDAVTGYFTAARRQGLIRDCDPDFLTRIFLAMLDGNKLCQPYDETSRCSPAEQEALISGVVELLMTGIKPDH